MTLNLKGADRYRRVLKMPSAHQALGTARPSSSAEKKRALDRRAQQKRRDKIKTHIRELKQKLASCKDCQSRSNTTPLQDIIVELRTENQVLKNRLQHLARLLLDWEVPTSPTLHGNLPFHSNSPYSASRLARLFQGPVRTVYTGVNIDKTPT
ncbi:hypothetical protein LTR10_024311 [Elasticomyces elasticus]|uniref:BZIP domain-containing protein n=1 Tax=Exophiala sideris TaxID=1016849 RepID=A0ABR0ITY5_9EURO|nr:hypothetical protein LTR10_024311 [Elasticomyces elasticus]KAK5020558.1 hypothetical protein LTS07_011519 [Exophiala sideris]KAK5022071.1 hypothetical protein LTR13_011482 [Exophiala sideris]KAK5047391.1 hypothetical protein LTR69_011527 [Exophiala sideris]KAK5175917.1 hypothetical protein LTR44_011523 [Eurotiomycetes sp. CCFEE 6388]